VTQHKSVSDETAHKIDEEVRSIVDRNYARANSILTEQLEKLHVMAAALMKYETIDSDQIDDIMAGKEPRIPTDWMDDDSGGPPLPAAGKTDEPKTDSTIGGPASSH
jgi:cell division protease FtsH